MDDDDDDFNVKTWATLHDAALEVLSTPSAHKKALLTQVIAKKWFDGKSILKARDVSSSGKRVKETPERDALVTIVSSNSNKLKLGSGRSIESRRKILHSLSHIESWAIDLSWDIIARFGHEVEKEREFFRRFRTRGFRRSETPFTVNEKIRRNRRKIRGFSRARWIMAVCDGNVGFVDASTGCRTLRARSARIRRHAEYD